MRIMRICTRRLNLNLSPKTYEEIQKIAKKEGRKAGNMARHILDKWANDNANKKD